MPLPEARSEVEKLIAVIRSFPSEQQEALAAYYRAEVEHLRDVDARLDALPPEGQQRLRQLLQEGADSGPAEQVDFEAVKRRGRARLGITLEP